jgi:transcription initiation factor TFIID subunit 3
MDESFHFALLRVSIAQIIKANGFDKCKPSTLNIVTDIYLQYLKKLIQQALRCSQLRNRSNTVEIQDLTAALILTSAIKPENYLKLEDSGENARHTNSSLTKVKKSAYNTQSMDSFVGWIKDSESFRLSRKLNELPSSLIKNLMEKRKLDLDDGETDQEKKKRKYKERQDYYNQLKLTDHGTSSHIDDMYDDMNDRITSKDNLSWINYLIEKDLKLGHDLKFFNSSLYEEFLKFQTNLKFHPVMTRRGDSNKTPQELAQEKFQQFQNHLNSINNHDYVLINIEDKPQDENGEDIEGNDVRPSQELENLLPYNIRYDSYLLDDDLDQYVEYRNKHNQHNIVEDDENAVNTIDQDTNFDDDGIGGDNNLIFL